MCLYAWVRRGRGGLQPEAYPHSTRIIGQSEYEEVTKQSRRSPTKVIGLHIPPRQEELFAFYRGLPARAGMSFLRFNLIFNLIFNLHIFLISSHCEGKYTCEHTFTFSLNPHARKARKSGIFGVLAEVKKRPRRTPAGGVPA